MAFEKMKTSAEYKQVMASGYKIVSAYFVLFFMAEGCVSFSPVTYPTKNVRCDLVDKPLIGFIASKKVGGAVKRNRCRRVLRAISHHHFSSLPFVKCNKVIKIVVVARQALLVADFCDVYSEFKKCLHRAVSSRLRISTNS
ncbi:ribonuclease P protein component [Alphaproteobacteria bacterium]